MHKIASKLLIHISAINKPTNCSTIFVYSSFLWLAFEDTVKILFSRLFTLILLLPLRWVILFIYSTVRFICFCFYSISDPEPLHYWFYISGCVKHYHIVRVRNIQRDLLGVLSLSLLWFNLSSVLVSIFFHPVAMYTPADPYKPLPYALYFLSF